MLSFMLCTFYHMANMNPFSDFSNVAVLCFQVECLSIMTPYHTILLPLLKGQLNLVPTESQLTNDNKLIP